MDTLAQQKQLFHEHLVNVIDYCQTARNTVEVLIEHSAYSLKEEQMARKDRQNLFTAEELENVLVSVMKGLRYLEE